MEAKKLAKLVKVLVEAEVAKQQEKFLSKTFPKILKEEIKRIQESKQPITNELIDSHALPSKIRDFLNSICQKGKNYCIYYIPINISNYKK